MERLLGKQSPLYKKMEEIIKVDANTVEITLSPAVKISKTLEELKSDLEQAKNSLEDVKKIQAEQLIPIQENIDILQRRLDEASKLNVN